MPMSQREALEVVAKHRGERVVISTMGAVGDWPALSDTPKDFAYIPSSMGQGPAIGLGLALAQPDRGVVVLCGDGSLLMNLGCLVTIAQHPANVWLVLLDNGLYEVTGGQPVVGSGRTDYAGLARAAGIGRVYQFDKVADWQSDAAAVFAGAGPVFAAVRRRPPRPGRWRNRSPVYARRLAS